MVVVNGYFRSQVVTGQQRYATEIANRLLRNAAEAKELRPTPWAARSRGHAWAELQVRGRVVTRTSTLLSLTSRTPLFTPRQVVTIHDLFPLTNPEWYSRRYATLHSQVLKHHLRHAGGIVAVSDPVADAIRSLASPDIPVVVAPNAPTAALVSSRPADTADGSYYLAVGSLEPRKNLPALISAYGLLSAPHRAEHELLIVGQEAALFRQVAGLKNDVPKGVRFLGRVPDAELAALYGNAMAFVTVSLDEGFGLPIVEAASSARGNLVVSDIPVYRWVTRGAAPIFVDPSSVESIAAGLMQASSAVPNLDDLRSIASRFSWDRSAAIVGEIAAQVDEEARTR